MLKASLSYRSIAILAFSFVPLVAFPISVHCAEQDNLEGMNLVRYIYSDYILNIGTYPRSMVDLLSHTASMRQRGKLLENGHQVNALERLKSKKPEYQGVTFVNYYIQSTDQLGYIRSEAVAKRTNSVVVYSDENVLGMEGHPKPYGYYAVLRSNKAVEEVPVDVVSYYRRPIESNLVVQSLIFPGDDGEFQYALTFEELWQQKRIPVTIAKSSETQKTFVVDNGGPESLIQLSRHESFPNIYGIDRDALWKQFDPSQAEFTLADVQAGATKLGLDTQVQKQSLAQLQKSGSPALLFLKDDGRIVTLISLDDDRAVVVDRGLTRNVERNVLKARYSGEALVPTKALTQQAGIVADDAVRSLQLKSLDEEVPQRFTLRNTGQKPVTLQLEYPLLGVTESKLSKDTLAPGESATLDLKVKWRSILKAPSQNVLVSLGTSDPIVPRLQLATVLNPPRAAAK